MGRTSRSVLIHFMAEELPPSLKIFGILYAVFNFRPKLEACVNCRQVGHRLDVCPLPNRLTCPGCGQEHPANHPCTPECVVGEDAHTTGDRASHVETSPHCHLCPSTRADFDHTFLNCPNKPKLPWRG
ncbi:hypothetical protein HPB49_005995 [Dermacentor silvarum]|uniref:Uncharacterized protein n=1 Tax=Dermacentor silvarum TaxID=543639 RepID=A0ACB8D381_DERSI|nr:hypothetical protein HPB49_005995 [Dermacentor silvarum]